MANPDALSEQPGNTAPASARRNDVHDPMWTTGLMLYCVPLWIVTLELGSTLVTRGPFINLQGQRIQEFAGGSLQIACICLIPVVVLLGLLLMSKKSRGRGLFLLTSPLHYLLYLGIMLVLHAMAG